jgi:hypothetical protein
MRVDYIPVTRPWTWATGTPSERADAIRSHALKLNSVAVRDLFQLTESGLDKILAGDIWRPDHTDHGQG